MMGNVKTKRTVLVYHLYVVNNWKQVTTQLLSQTPHDDIYISITYDLRYVWMMPYVIFWLKFNFRIKKFFFCINNAKYGEVLSLTKIRNAVDWNAYSVLSYMHSKGVTKPSCRCVADWRELMRYFIIDRFADCKAAFSKGYALYGVNLYANPELKEYAFQFAPFIYRGNFVCVNLDLLRDVFISTPIPLHYYGVEGFWGQLCGIEDAYCAHESGVKHYEQEYPDALYKHSA